MIVLGLDPSLTGFGWCLYDGTSVLDKGLFKTKKDMMFVERYAFLRGSVDKIFLETHIDKVGIEHPVFQSTYSEGMYALFVFICESLWRNKRDTVFFSPLQVKAQARETLGYGKDWKMQKADMINAAKKKDADIKKWNHNEADAFWVASAAFRFWLLQDKQIQEDDLSEVEKHQYTKTHTFVRGKKAGKTEESGIVYRENERFFLWSNENKG